MKHFIFLFCIFPLFSNSVGLVGELLYWQPCTATYRWGMADQEKLVVRPRYTTGIRGGINYQACNGCIFAHLLYTYYQECCHSTLNHAGQLVFDFPFSLNIDRAKASQKIRYQNVDFRMGLNLHECYRVTVKLFGALRYISLQQNQRIDGEIQGDVARTRMEKGFKGGAIGAGIGALYQICQNFSLDGEIQLLIGAGIQRNRLFINLDLDLDLDLNSAIPSNSACITGVDIRIGPSYSLCTSLVTFRVQLAYEIHHYLDILRSELLDHNTPVFSVGFQGLTASIQAKF